MCNEYMCLRVCVCLGVLDLDIRTHAQSTPPHHHKHTRVQLRLQVINGGGCIETAIATCTRDSDNNKKPTVPMFAHTVLPDSMVNA